MESRLKPPGFNGVIGASDSRRGYVFGAGGGVGIKPPPPTDRCGVVLRLFIMAETLVAAVVMAVDRQTITVADDTLLTTVTAKWSDSTAFMYFVVANALACLFSALSLAVHFRGRSAVVMIGDLLVLALLFSAVGAAAEFGILGERGNSHVRWAKVCDVLTSFCERAMAAVVVSLVAAFTNLVHLMLAILDIHKNSSYY